VIDDLGNDRAQADALFRLSYTLTFSVLPHEVNSGEIAEEAHRRGYEVMLHLPMASNAGNLDEAVELHPGMAAADVEKTFSAMLETVPYASGVNNHEGSLSTSDQKLMDELMPMLHERKLFFIDSRTTAATVAESAAHAAGVATARRNVFLDDEQSVAAPASNLSWPFAMQRKKVRLWRSGIRIPPRWKLWEKCCLKRNGRVCAWCLLQISRSSFRKNKIRKLFGTQPEYPEEKSRLPVCENPRGRLQAATRGPE
jgi:hypothetical protein